MKGLKKFLCVILSVVMVLGSLTVTAFAANSANKVISTNTTTKMSGNFYGSTSSGTKTGIALTINNGITATIDMNGYRIYFNGSSYSTIVNNGTLSLTDSNPGVNYIYNLNTSKTSPAVIQNNSTLTIGAGIKVANMNTSSTNTTPLVDQGPSIINDGTLNIKDDAIIAGKIVNNDGGKVNITGGYFYEDPTQYLTGSYAAVADTSVTGCNYKVVSAPYVVTYSDGTTATFEKSSDAMSAILAREDASGTISIATSTIDDTFAIDNAAANITLNLNNQTVKIDGDKPFATVTSGALKVTNGKIDLTDKTGDAAKINVGNAGVFSLDNAEITGGTDPVINSAGVVIIDGVVTTSGIVSQSQSAAVLDEVSGKVKDDVTLTITAAVALTSSSSVVIMKYQANGKTKEVAGTKDANGFYTFTTEEGIDIINLDEDLNLQIFVDNTAVSAVKSITIQDYLNEVHSENSDNTVQDAFIAELVDFAMKLQEYNATYHEGPAATIKFAGWEEGELIAVAPEETDSVKEVVTNAKKDSDKVKNAYISISDRASVCFNLNASKGARILVTLDDASVYDSKAEEAGDQTIKLDTISPLKYDGTYVITLYDAKTDAINYQLKYSVNSYCYAKMADETVGDVANAMYCYGYAAKALKQEEEISFGPVSFLWTNDGDTCTASRTSTDGTITQQETATATQETVYEGSGVVASMIKKTANFVNPAFATQVTTAPETKEANTGGSKTQTAYDKHLILNSDGSYGGSYDVETYGEGAPLNGALDNAAAGYYAINDYYNTKCTDTRTILTGFSAYQQTMQYTDGIASVRMALNYCDDTFAANNSEKDMLDKYESLNTSYTYSDNMSVDGLKSLVESYGYTAEIPDTIKASSSYWSTFENLIIDTINSGKIMMLRWQQGEEARWCVVLGVDTMGNAKTNADPVILAVPFDAYDQYQDGYQVVSLPVLFNWWKEQSQSSQTAINSHEALIITPPSTNAITLQTDNENDNIKTYPFAAEKHLLLNANGTYGGELNTALYGNEGTALNGAYKNSDGNYEYVDAQEYNYFGKADYYNMSDTSTLSICENFEVFQQTMASSCGICSTLNALNYLGYDFTNLDNYVKHNTRTTNNAYQEGEIVKITLSDGETEVGHYDKVQEALLNVYMQTDSHFDSTSQFFNGYGYVGAKTLSYIGDTLGLEHTYSNYVPGSATPTYTTYDAFKEFMTGRLAQNLPTVISWAPGVGHWETVIGFDDMGTESPYDDVIVLADSADSHDQYQDGYNTYPASQFYGQWYNGSASVGQACVAYSALS